jgi:plastocyanin
MYRRRRVTSAALALAAVLAVSACSEADNGNNSLAGRTQQPEVTSAAPTPTGGAQTTPPATGDEEIKLEAKDSEFAPKEITAKAGTITILMDNTGQAPHTFTNKDLGVDVNANAGEKAQIKIENAKPGKYTFVCIYHEAAGMVGELTVT